MDMGRNEHIIRDNLSSFFSQEGKVRLPANDSARSGARQKVVTKKGLEGEEHKIGEDSKCT